MIAFLNIAQIQRIFKNAHVKWAFKLMHLIWSVCISVYIILHLIPVILFAEVTEGFFVIHLLLWQKKYILDILSLWVCHLHPWAFQIFYLIHWWWSSDPLEWNTTDPSLLPSLLYPANQTFKAHSSTCTTSLFIFVSFISPCISLQYICQFI